MSEHIAFSTLEPVDDFEPSAHQWYDILRNAIQLDNKISTDDAVQNLVAIFPDTYPIGHELSIFEETCCEVAEQMPYHHASQNKLVTLLDLVLHSDKVIRPTDDPETDKNTRYVRLGQTIRDIWNSSRPSEGAAAYVNFQSFSARLVERSMLEGTDLEVWTIEDVFKEPSKVDQAEMEPRVIVASQCILLVGQQIYAEILNPPKEGSYVSQKQWRKWHAELEAAASQKPPKRYEGLGQEAKEMAGRAAEEMSTIERKMGGASSGGILKKVADACRV